MPQVVVLLPGILGSELWLNNQRIWPPDDPICKRNGPYPRPADLVNPAAVAKDLIRGVWVIEQYSEMIAHLSMIGYPEKKLSDTISGDCMIAWPYDWRLDNAETARKLAKELGEFAAKNPSAEFTLLCHSMGGLVARYYLESTELSAHPVRSKVRQCLFMGTPSKGSPAALVSILGLRSNIFLTAKQVRELANTPGFPSSYQLAPPQGTPYVWDARRNAKPFFPAIDPFENSPDNPIWPLLNPEHVRSAATFWSSLDLSRRPNGCRYFTFCGTRMPTVSVCVLKSNRPVVVDSKQIDDAGEGTVPVWSSGLEGIQRLEVDGEHSVLYKSPALLRVLTSLLNGGPADNLSGVLTEAAAAEAPSPTVTLSTQVMLRSEAAAGETPLRVLLALDGPPGPPVKTKTGQVRICRSAQKDGKMIRGRAQQTVPIDMPKIGRSVTVDMKPPKTPGLFEVGLYTSAKAKTPIAWAYLVIWNEKDE